MTSVAEKYVHVVGVDTHAKTHMFTIVNASTGQVVMTHQFPTTHTGINRAFTWISSHGHPNRLMVVEGIGSYGAVFTQKALDQGETVVEAEWVTANVKRGRGKSDELDSIRIARSVLGVPIDRLRHPRTDQGIRDALRVLIIAREAMTGEKTQHINRLIAVLRTTDLGMDTHTKLTQPRLRCIAGWRRRHESLAVAVARNEAVRLATRILMLTTEEATNKTMLTTIIKASPYAELLTPPGIGPVTAAILLISWGTPGRIHSEPSWAALGGVSPVPASSGNTTRHRLNRGGDRRLNKAFTIIAKHRLLTDPTTQAYRDRRLKEGRTIRDILRCLKRYVARHTYRLLTHLDPHPDTTNHRIPHVP
jgi:transposase